MNSSNSESDFIGVSCFFDFLCAVFSRIAYEETPRPLYLLSQIFSSIIPEELIIALSKITNISELNDDTALLTNLGPNNKIKIRKYNGQNYVNFIEYAEKINILIEGYQRYGCYTFPTSTNIILEAIATSNYGNVLIIGVKTMPNFVFTAFRGTYSGKTAASYTRPSSLFPVQISPNTKILWGIGKILFEMLYTILEANKYIAQQLLQANNNPNVKSVIPVFTGHSLGGGMATILDYEYCKEGPKIIVPVPVLAEVPICITFGSPRVLSKTTSENLCKRIIGNKTLFRRYSNDGDPVTALPPVNYYHPCSSKNDKASGYRKIVARDCKSSTLTTKSIANLMPSDYVTDKITSDLPHAYSESKKAIKCRDTEASIATKLSNSAPNMFDHMTYLYVSFARAATITDLVASSTIGSHEVSRVKKDFPYLNLTKGDTIMTITHMVGDDGEGKYTSSAIDLVKIRKPLGNTKLLIDGYMDTGLFELTKNGSFYVQNVNVAGKNKAIKGKLTDPKYLESLKKNSIAWEMNFKNVEVGDILDLSLSKDKTIMRLNPNGEQYKKEEEEKKRIKEEEERIKMEREKAENAAKPVVLTEAEKAKAEKEARAEIARAKEEADWFAAQRAAKSAVLTEEQRAAKEAMQKEAREKANIAAKSVVLTEAEQAAKEKANIAAQAAQDEAWGAHLRANTAAVGAGRNKTKRSRNKTKRSRNKTKRSRNKLKSKRR